MVPYSGVPARTLLRQAARGGRQLAGAGGEAQVRAGDFPSWLSHQINGHDKLTCRRRSCPSPSLLPSLFPAPPRAGRGGAGEQGGGWSRVDMLGGAGRWRRCSVVVRGMRWTYLEIWGQCETISDMSGVRKTVKETSTGK